MENAFAPFRKIRQTFVVKNISEPKKTIRIFHYPINQYEERDLLQIPGVAESDIRASLLKGELLHKILAKEVVITNSDIDLLQFNEDQKLFLRTAGVIKGLEIEGQEIASETITIDKLDPGVVLGGGSIPFIWRQGISLSGAKDGTNRIFTVPNKFLNGSYGSNIFKIQVVHNGRILEQTKEYIAQESVPGGGFDTIVILTFAPSSNSELFADYVSLV